MPSSPEREWGSHRIVTALLQLAVVVVLVYTVWETRKMSRIDQRAWVGAVAASIPDIGEGSTLLTDVALSNSGKTFARKVCTRTFVSIQLEGEEFAPVYPEIEGLPPSEGTLQPGQEITVKAEMRPAVTKEEAEGILDRTRVLYVYGTVTYEDIFDSRHRHSTTFGYRYVPSVRSWRVTETHNEAN